MSLEGILPVVPTPFRDGRFDDASFGAMLERMLDGVDGYTLLGSTGEAPSLTTAERIDIARRALALTPPDKSVVVGIGHTSAGEAIRIALDAQESGAVGVLCPAPFYFANTPDGILDYLQTIDDAIAIELVLYDNPVASGTILGAEQVLRYAGELGSLGTVKLTDHDLSKIPVWQEAGLTVLAGDDAILFRYLDAGVDGAMVIAPALFPDAFARVWRHVRAGDRVESLRTLATEILPVLHVFGIGDEVPTTKALLAEMGVFASDELRPPLEPVTPERRAVLLTGLAATETRPTGPSSRA